MGRLITVVLGGVVDSEFVMSPRVLKVKGKLPTGVLTTLVRVEDLDPHTKLCATVHLIFLVCSQGITLLPQEVQGGESHGIVCKGDIVMSASKCCNWGWAPQVRVDFTSKFSCTLPLMHLSNRLLSGFCIHTRFTELCVSGRGGMNLDSGDQPLLDEFLSHARGNMAHPTMDFHGGEGVKSCVRGIGKVDAGPVHSSQRLRDSANDVIHAIEDCTHAATKGGGVPSLVKSSNRDEHVSYFW